MLVDDCWSTGSSWNGSGFGRVGGMGLPRDNSKLSRHERMFDLRQSELVDSPHREGLSCPFKEGQTVTLADEPTMASPR